MICGTPREELLVEISKLAREGRVDYLLVESTGLSEPLPGAEPRLGRRTALTFPLPPPPQKN
jgi:G3E family GTPase